MAKKKRKFENVIPMNRNSSLIEIKKSMQLICIETNKQNKTKQNKPNKVKKKKQTGVSTLF